MSRLSPLEIVHALYGCGYWVLLKKKLPRRDLTRPGPLCFLDSVKRVNKANIMVPGWDSPGQNCDIEELPSTSLSEMVPALEVSVASFGGPVARLSLHSISFPNFSF